MSQPMVFPRHPNFNDLTGQTFGRLMVLGYAGKIGKRKEVGWNVRCICGTEKVVRTRHLRAGTSSCGCLIDDARHANTTHGMYSRPEYKIWSHMISRCFKPHDKSYPDYGGRGITVCARWKDSVEAFIEDMGPKPQGHEIDRINNDGNYEPGNCRWVTRSVNALNKRSNHILTFDGKSMSATEWARLRGWKRSVIQNRLRMGWSVERILTTPLLKHYGPRVKRSQA